MPELRRTSQNPRHIYGHVEGVSGGRPRYHLGASVGESCPFLSSVRCFCMDAAHPRQQPRGIRSGVSYPGWTRCMQCVCRQVCQPHGIWLLQPSMSPLQAMQPSRWDLRNCDADGAFLRAGSTLKCGTWRVAESNDYSRESTSPTVCPPSAAVTNRHHNYRN